MNTSLNETPKAERLHIGIFGRRNAGKSSLLNALTGQNAAVVSPVKGTTTDPVFKAMELLPIGPVMFIDTAGIDDMGELGSLRVRKTMDILRKTDVALLVVDRCEGLHDEDRQLIETFKSADVRHLVVCTKSDLPGGAPPDGGINVSAQTGENIEKLKQEIARIAATEDEPRRFVADLLAPGDMVVLVVPIDKAAPKGRLILPQQQAIRDILDGGCACTVTRDTELADTLNRLKTPPKLVITDSQVFKTVAKITPDDVGLTSFSILMSRYKGVLNQAVRGAKAIDDIKDADKILISEGCTHHRQCDDIATVKLPKMIESYTGAKPEYEYTSGGEFARNLSDYKLIIHCGGCMLNNREMRYRSKCADEAGVPMTNFGVAISHMQGILARCTATLDRINPSC